MKTAITNELQVPKDVRKNRDVMRREMKDEKNQMEFFIGEKYLE